ncbi:DUF6750 family protein [Achromobacter xylosoxidans]
MWKFIRKTLDQVETGAQQAHCNMVCSMSRAVDSASGRFIVLMLIGATVSLFLADAAMAQGIAGMANTAAGQSDQVKESAKRIFGGLGLLSGGYGAYNWFRKGKEGENSRITGGQIIVPFLAGAGLGAVAYMINTAGQTVGMPTVQ